ncbi:DUF982 domain-containing protein [Shinella zoogloeoides]|uniref:DUF982 domain-containing protein n=1 Tax=Shinella zoogloeoides TaxID=352475 RepID=UPI0039185780
MVTSAISRHCSTTSRISRTSRWSSVYLPVKSIRSCERYQRARIKCRAALDRLIPVAVAREAFVAACLEAGMAIEAMAPAWHGSWPATPPRMSA